MKDDPVALFQGGKKSNATSWAPPKPIVSKYFNCVSRYFNAKAKGFDFFVCHFICEISAIAVLIKISETSKENNCLPVYL